jgi:hypothetical protein
MNLDLPRPPRFMLLVPWWLAIFAWMIWLCYAILVWSGALLFVTCILAGRLIARGWAAWRLHRHPAPER